MITLFLIYFASIAQAGSELDPENWGNFCPAGFSQKAPKDFHTNIPLNFVDKKGDELHRLVCERFDAQTGLSKGKWNLYFCEDINPNNYKDESFYVPVTPWFVFHPNFKRAEFMLFPKYTKWVRHKLPISGKFQEVMTLHFMKSHDSEMEIIFQNSSTTQTGMIKKGSVSASAIIFQNLNMKPSEDPVFCTIQ